MGCITSKSKDSKENNYIVCVFRGFRITPNGSLLLVYAIGTNTTHVFLNNDISIEEGQKALPFLNMYFHHHINYVARMYTIRSQKSGQTTYKFTFDNLKPIIITTDR